MDWMNPFGVPVLVIIFSALALIVVGPKLPIGRAGKSVVAVFGVGLLLLPVGYALYPMATSYMTTTDDLGHEWIIDPIADVTAANWDDTIYTDVDLADATQHICRDTFHTCTVLVAATEVSGAENTIAPDEVLIQFSVKRKDDDPDIPNADDYATIYGIVHGLPTYTNTTDNSVHEVIASNDQGQPYVYWDDNSQVASLYDIGTKVPLGQFQPGESSTYIRVGFVLNPTAFGIDGQTAGLSSVSISIEIGGYHLTLTIQTNSIS